MVRSCASREGDFVEGCVAAAEDTRREQGARAENLRVYGRKLLALVPTDVAAGDPAQASGADSKSARAPHSSRPYVRCFESGGAPAI